MRRDSTLYNSWKAASMAPWAYFSSLWTMATSPKVPMTGRVLRTRRLRPLAAKGIRSNDEGPDPQGDEIPPARQGLLSDSQPSSSISVLHAVFRPPSVTLVGGSAPVALVLERTGAQGINVTLAALSGFEPSASAGSRKGKKGKKGRRPHDADNQRHEVNNPENPMKARDRVPATINTNPMFRATAGTSESSILSRMDAMRTRASVTPKPAPRA